MNRYKSKSMLRLKDIMILVFLCFSCGQESSIPIIDLEKEYPIKKLSLDEIMMDIEMIPLESKPEALIGRGSAFYIGEKYIFSSDRKNILMFGRDGSFIRKIASAGNGPDEFIVVLDMILSPDEKYLILSDHGSPNSLRFFDIENDSIHTLDVPGYTRSMAWLSDNLLAGIGAARDPVRYYVLNVFSGEVLKTVHHQSDIASSPTYKLGFLESNDSEVFFIPELSDTVYVIEEDYSLDPRMVISLKKTFDFRKESEGSAYYPALVNESYLLFSTIDATIHLTEEGGSDPEIHDISSTLIELESGEGYEVKNYQHELVPLSNGISSRTVKRGRFLVVVYESSYWIENIKELETSVEELLPNSFLEKSKSIKPDDNPILLIGNDLSRMD